MHQVVCPVLIAREDEFRVLRDGLDAAVAGRGQVVFVRGEAGVGKSRLARELTAHADAQGVTVLTGRAVAGGVPTAFRPFAEALLSGLRRHPVPDTDELRSYRPVLGSLVPEWRPRTRIPGAESPVAVGEGLLRLLGVLGGDRGCLLVLEDLHDADPESLAVLEYLAQNIGRARILCMGTVRDEKTGPGVELVGSLTDGRIAQVVDLSRLDADATTRLSRACLGATVLPTEVESSIRAGAEGLPFLAEELLAGLVGAGVLVERDGAWSVTGAVDWHLPPSFAAAVTRRLDALAGGGRGVLRAAAVLGRTFDWRLLPAISELDEATVVAALREATEAHLLTVSGATFGFRHALTREAVLADLVPPDREHLAARGLAALEQAHPGLDGGWGELAARLAEDAGQHTRAAELLLDLGRRAISAGALATAEGTLRRARSLLVASPQLEIRIDDALIEVFELTGQIDLAFDLGDQLVGRLDMAALLPTGAAGLHRRLARVAVAAGRWDLAADHLTATRITAPLQVSAPDASDEVIAAQIALGRGQLENAARFATAALAAAERTGHPATACEALEVIGRVARQRSLAEAENAFGRGLSIARSNGLEFWRLRALHELGTVDQLRTETVDRLRQARELALDLGALALVATLDLQIAAGLVKQFRPDEGLAAARSCIEASHRLGLATLPMALIAQAAAHGQLGDSDEMESSLREALAVAPDDLDVTGCAAGHCRATAALLAEDRALAISEMTEGAELLERSPATVSPPFLGLRVLLLAVDGADHDAQEAAERVRKAGATRHELVAHLVSFAEAVLLGRTGQRTEAESLFAATNSSMGPLVDWYKHYARRLVAEAALQDGWGAPVDWLREAAAYFAARGDVTLAAACRGLLRSAGVAVPRPGRGPSGVPADLHALGVTRREADVLTLVTDGLTNRELAARLHLSPRTVEKHVASLLTKTGCSRRGQLAGYTARLPG